MNEREQVLELIKAKHESEYDVLINPSGAPKFHIGSVVPDAILVNKIDRKPVFVIQVVDKKESLPVLASTWKNYSNLPGTFYVVVRDSFLGEARSLAALNGANPKFGFYKFGDEKAKELEYES